MKRRPDDQIYALKKVKIQNLSDREKENALNEVRILASIRNPCVAAYKEAFFDEASSSLWYVNKWKSEVRPPSFTLYNVIKTVSGTNSSIVQHCYGVCGRWRRLLAHNYKQATEKIHEREAYMEDNNLGCTWSESPPRTQNSPQRHEKCKHLPLLGPDGKTWRS